MKEPIQNQENDAMNDELKRKKRKKIKRVILTSVLVLTIFFGGMTTGWFLLEPEFRSLIKMKIAIDNFYYTDVDDDTFFNTIFNAINQEVLDDYSWYMSAEEYQEYTSAGEGNQSGIGIVFLIQDVASSSLYVSRVCGNSPAERAGIEAGDYVLGIGRTASGLNAFENFESFLAYLNEFETSEPFYLQVQKGGGEDAEIQVVSLSKENYMESYVFYRTATTAYGFEGEKGLHMVEKGKPLSSLDDKTAYIRLTSFNGAVVEEFAQAMNQFRVDGMQNLVLDLRGNGGGYVHMMQSIASYFCKNTQEAKPVVAVADYGTRKHVFKANGNYYNEYFTQESRICVLADANSASASECLIGSMLDYGTISYSDICLSERNGQIKTYGKGIMQTTYTLGFGGDAIKLTTALIRWPLSNNCIHGRGVLPEDGALYVTETGDFEEETALSLAKLFS